jgi:hypothetical protein
MIVIFTDVTDAVAIASRVFALYFVLQSVIAVTLATRSRSWPAATGIAAVGLTMAAVTIFGVPI